MTYEFFAWFPRPLWERVRVRGKTGVEPRFPLTPALSRNGEREADGLSIAQNSTLTEKLVFDRLF